MKTAIEPIIGIFIIIILGIFLNPTKLLMPNSVNTLLILLFIIGFLMFIALIWKEKAEDERENAHIQKAGRYSYMAGACVLTTGIIVQAYMHSIDPWLVYSLSIMVLVKIISRLIQKFVN